MTITNTAELFDELQSILTPYQQTHLLDGWEALSNEQQLALAEQIKSQDWALITKLIESHVSNKPDFHLDAEPQPAPYYPYQAPEEQLELYEKAKSIGEDFLKAGKVAAFTVAGGQGTRLGWDGPKGTFPATAMAKKTLFQVFTEYLTKASLKYGKSIPWYIMTSPINDAPTRAFFEENKYFGYPKQDIMFFPQGTMPSISYEGKVLMSAPGQLALNPDGHGGSLLALYKSGAIADMKQRGIEQISYFQVDNPSVRCVDPLFIGLHVNDQADMSSKILEKAYPKEKLGNLCIIDGKVSVIEYSDLPDELAEQRTENGQLRFRAGSIAIHLISVAFVDQINAGEFGLPFHRADKKVPYYDQATGEQVKPESPNAVKLETFVFDALPLCNTSIILETDRVEEFAPIKNAEGVDSAVTSVQLQSQRAGNWLALNGVDVACTEDGTVNATIEISGLTAIAPEDLRGLDLPTTIEAGTSIEL